jgi:hypothetical protein
LERCALRRINLDVRDDVKILFYQCKGVSQHQEGSRPLFLSLTYFCHKYFLLQTSPRWMNFVEENICYNFVIMTSRINLNKFTFGTSCTTKNKSRRSRLLYHARIKKAINHYFLADLFFITKCFLLKGSKRRRDEYILFDVIHKKISAIFHYNITVKNKS